MVELTINCVIIASVTFLVLWLVTGLVWAIWLSGIAVPIAGAITSVAVVGTTFLTNN